jgi:Cys-tRNA(Pro)/Cys-tRNA(Cys) deacylase
MEDDSMSTLPKTNAVRMLATRGISFELLSYEVDESDLSAVSVAAKAGIDINRVFKTLVLRDSSAEVFVCVIPGACDLDLKKAARAAGVKKADLIPVKDILKLTGYIRGGCSPVGMKKTYPTFIDETCQLYEQIYVSAGARGLQLLISPGDLIDVVSAQITELV